MGKIKKNDGNFPADTLRSFEVSFVPFFLDRHRHLIFSAYRNFFGNN